MIKILNYLLQSLLIYIFFFIGRILGLKIGRRFFSLIFSLIGPNFKSKKIIENNLNNVSNYLPNLDKKKIISNMWKNYGMTLVEYVFLNNFRKENSHVIIKDSADLSKISKNKKPVIFVSGHLANFEVPACPGRHIIFFTNFELLMLLHKACSLPPLPINPIFMFGYIMYNLLMIKKKAKLVFKHNYFDII